MRYAGHALFLVLLAVLIVAASACGATSLPDDVSGGVKGECRQPSVSSTDKLYQRFEAPTANNACTQDTDCVVGGCSGEVCAAEPLASDCDIVPYRPAGSCGCVAGACVWYTSTCK